MPHWSNTRFHELELLRTCRRYTCMEVLGMVMHFRSGASHKPIVLGIYNVSQWNRRGPFARRIMQVMHGADAGIDYFVEWLKRIVPADCVVVCVPSATPGRKCYGVAQMSRRVAQEVGAVDGTQCLIRTERIPKMACKGLRGEKVHFDSIEVCDAELFRDRVVYLLDDVTTSGASIRACEFLLLSAGAAAVQPVVLARAVRPGFDGLI